MCIEVTTVRCIRQIVLLAKVE